MPCNLFVCPSLSILLLLAPAPVSLRYLQVVSFLRGNSLGFGSFAYLCRRVNKLVIMKKYIFKCRVTLGNTSTLETNTQKKALADFLRSFKMKPTSRKIRLGECTSGSLHVTDISYENPDYLKVLRFSESLRAFCLFWHVFYEEFDLCEMECPDEKHPP